MSHHRTTGRAFLAITCLFLFGACTPANTTDDTASSASTPAPASEASTAPADYSSLFPPIQDSVVKDQTHWSLPTDPYTDSLNFDLRFAAIDHFRVPCMHDAGFTQFRSGTVLNAPQSETTAADGLGAIFDEGLAAKYGYRLAPDPRDAFSSLYQNDPGAYDDESKAFRAAEDTCWNEALTAIGEPRVDPGTAADETSTVDETSVTYTLERLHVDTGAPELQAAASQWRECMAPLGIPDLPTEPWLPGNYPPQSLIDRWNWSPTGTPTADEITIATHDAQCRRSSGWFDTLYEAEWKLREDFVAANKADLDPVLAKNNEDRKRYLAIIAGQTP